MSEVIKLENVSFAYDKDKLVLKNINLQINSGERIAIIGKNGSGKSTLGLLLCGICDKFTGKYFLNGTEINNKTIDIIKDNVGIIFQNPDNQFIANSVEEDIAFGLENRRIPVEEMKKMVLNFATKVGMEKFLKQEPSNLSGGQKQRVALAAMLALNQNILIFDESTSMLDLKAKEDISNLVEEVIKQNKNMTILNITHDIEESKNADKILILDKGEIKFFDTPEKLFNNEKLIDEFKLNIPFTYQLKKVLEKENIKIDSKKSLEEISKEIYDQVK